MAECVKVEPCLTGDCDGFDEVVSLLPSGPIWNPDRGGVYSQYIHALGDIKTELNKRICQEWAEINPCTAVRLLPYWAKVWSLPECVEQTQESLCNWIGFLQNSCPRGSLGFLQEAIDFVAPGKGITIAVTYPDIGANCACPDKPCADDNPLIITAPPEAYAWADRNYDGPIYMQDGETCREYWIPEIECLRRCIFPFGLGIGYKTTGTGPLGQDIFGVPDENETTPLDRFTPCVPECRDGFLG